MAFTRIYTNLSLKHKVLVTMLLPLLVLLPVTAFLYISTVKYSESSAWVQHTYDVISKARLLEKEMIDLETGQRGFLLNGKDLFLEPFIKLGMIMSTLFKCRFQKPKIS